MANEREFPKVNGDILYGSEANALNIFNRAAGENITAQQAVYIKETDGLVYMSDKSNLTDNRITGIALNTATTGNTVNIQTGGNVPMTGLTSGEFYYLGSSAGAIGTIKNQVRVGLATSTTNLYLIPTNNSYEEYDKIYLGEIAWSVTDTSEVTLGTLSVPAGLVPSDWSVEVIGHLKNANTTGNDSMYYNIEVSDGTNTLTCDYGLGSTSAVGNPYYVKSLLMVSAVTTTLAQYNVLFAQKQASDSVYITTVRGQQTMAAGFLNAAWTFTVLGHSAAATTAYVGSVKLYARPFTTI